MIGTYVELRDQALRVENALRQVLERQEVWHCNRVWEAWAVDTMSRDDFSLVTEDPVAIEELVQAVMSVSGAATVSNAATEALVRKQQRYIEELERVDGVGLSERVEMLEVERDAALAAIERVRAMHREAPETGKCEECTVAPYSPHSVRWPCSTIQALDGAPEPEWDYRYAEIHDDGEMYTYGPDDGGGVYESAEAAASDRVESTDVVVRSPKRPARQWLPVEGEGK